jgi:hypothetical protein
VTWKGLEQIDAMTVDYEQDELWIRTIDGRVVRQSGGARPSSRPGGPFDFKRVTFRPADLVTTMLTTWDENLEVEVFDDDDQLRRRAGRCVIYLDQNKWVQIARAIHRPDRVHGPELDPTHRLIELAHAKKVILPISAGHWIETGPIDGERRLHLAAQMVGLSRGWIMRNPLLVRASELCALFTSQPDATIASITEAVFTLDAHQHHAEPSPAYIPKDPTHRHAVGRRGRSCGAP